MNDQGHSPIQYSQNKLLSVNFMQVVPVGHLKLNIFIALDFNEKYFFSNLTKIWV